MVEFTPLEQTLMAKMTPQHKALMDQLTPKERQSLAQNVKGPEDIERIQSWIGSDEAIEEILFWDRGGKFDDPQWQPLQPVDDTTGRLLQAAEHRYEQLKKDAVQMQRRSDLTLLSQFIPSLLFTGTAGAVRCDPDGRPDEKGRFFKGVELRCVGSVEDRINSITIYPVSTDAFEVHWGGRRDDTPQGVSVYTGDSYSLLQLAQLIGRSLSNSDFKTVVTNRSGDPVDLDSRAIRKVAMEGGDLNYDAEHWIYSSAQVNGIDAAVDRALELQQLFYRRFGLEVECSKIGKIYGNFVIMREDNFDQFLPDTPVKTRGLVMLTATLVCRRCRRELKDFRDFAKAFPEVTFALVNLSSPQFKFYERVFGDMGGGDVEDFRKTAAGVTPFVIIYSPGANGVLTYRKYLSTGKADAPPSGRATMEVLSRYFA